jgi:UDPglucose--hexose-1-phosphate uridylyltransferase
MIRTELADGRDLLYFDDADSALPEVRRPDTRTLEQRPPSAELRADPLTGEWVSNAAHRAGRAFLPPANACPLCPSTNEFASELPDQFDVAVFENRSPAFGPDVRALEVGHAGGASGLPLGSTSVAAGRCEVIVFSPEHEGSLADLGVNRIETVLGALQHRTDEFNSLPGMKQVFPFENRGEEIGVTLHHPHGQIYGYPFTTPRTNQLLAQVSKRGSDFYDELIAFEATSARLLFATDNFLAYVPFAARWPLEAVLLPKRQVADFVDLTASEIEELAICTQRLLKSFDLRFEARTPYIAAWHQAPLVTDRGGVRMRLHLTSPRRDTNKLKFLAGSESAMGVFIGDVPAEVQAAALREVMPA